MKKIGRQVYFIGDKEHFYESWQFYPKHGYAEYSLNYMRKELKKSELWDIYDIDRNDSTTKVSFSNLNKSEFSAVSQDLFNILADNMEIIAPTGNSREDDYKCWYEGVSNGLKRDERQIVLIKDADSIIGFFQYYTNADTFMMEEIQFKAEYQGKNIFRALYGFLIPNIREDLKFVEAYANIQNRKSIGILKKLGLSEIGMNKNGHSFHFKGKYSDLLKWYKSK